MRERIQSALSWGTAVAVLFGVVYGGAEWITARHGWRVQVHMPWELSVPLVPWFVVAYLSVVPMMWMAPVMLGSAREVRLLCWSLGAVIVVAGMGFLLCPAQLAFGPATEHPSVAYRLLNVADRINLDYNLVPSLHVAFAVTCAAAYASRRAWFWWAWAALIAVSTVLTHQHHVVDVVMGWVLGMAGGRLYRGMNQSQL